MAQRNIDDLDWSGYYDPRTQADPNEWFQQQIPAGQWSPSQPLPTTPTTPADDTDDTTPPTTPTTPTTNPYASTFSPNPIPPVGYTEGFTMPLMEEGDFNFPPEWGLAGMTLADMTETGMPVDINAYAQSQLPMLQTQMSDWAKQASEQAGLAGTRWSTPLQRNITEQANRLAQTYGADIAGKWLQSQESARGRQMEGAGGLMGLGSLYSQLPLQVSQQMMDMSGQMQGMGAAEIAPLLQEFMRTAPENNPWLQMLLGATSPGGYAPDMYQQGGSSQWMQMLSQLLPYLMKSGGSSSTATSFPPQYGY